MKFSGCLIGRIDPKEHEHHEAASRFSPPGVHCTGTHRSGYRMFRDTPFPRAALRTALLNKNINIPLSVIYRSICNTRSHETEKE
jgi:hypothetical protein